MVAKTLVGDEVELQFNYTVSDGWTSRDRMEPDEPREVEIYGPYSLIVAGRAHELETEAGEDIAEVLMDHMIESAWEGQMVAEEASSIDSACL